MTEKKMIKEIIKNDDGKALVVINISYPQIPSKAEKPSTAEKRFNGFYQKISDSLCAFAKSEMKKKAAAVCESAGFKPFSCVMEHMITFEDDDCVSVALDVFSYSGGETATKRAGQVWDIKNGFMRSASDIFEKDERKKILEHLYGDAEKRASEHMNEFYPDYKKRIKKYFKKDNFCITPEGCAFIFDAGTLNGKKTPVTLTVKNDFFHRERT